MKEYALYKGENCLVIGTIKEIASKMNIKENTARFYSSPAYKKRIARFKNAKVLIKIEDE